MASSVAAEAVSNKETAVTKEETGLTHECGVFGCIATGEWPTQIDVAQVICLGLVALQHRYCSMVIQYKQETGSRTYKACCPVTRVYILQTCYYYCYLAVLLHMFISYRAVVIVTLLSCYTCLYPTELLLLLPCCPVTHVYTLQSCYYYCYLAVLLHMFIPYRAVIIIVILLSCYTCLYPTELLLLLLSCCPVTHVYILQSCYYCYLAVLLHMFISYRPVIFIKA
jgi:hypothetical protein